MDRKTFEPGPVSKVECRRVEKGWTLVFVRELHHPPERVWAALTDPAELHEWSPFTASSNLGRAGDTQLTMIDGDVEEKLPATIRVADRPRVLEYTLGDDLLRWELEPTSRGTRLTLRHTVQDRDLVPKVAAGWHICIVVAEQLLDGQPVGPIRGHEAMGFGWQELHDAYARELGVATAE